ncbi:unnamed protein product [Alopecurus aequalis]
MGSKQQQLALRPISTLRGGGVCDEKANQSFRVYYSLSAGAVPFLWESTPGTPKRGGAATTTNAVVPESCGAGDGGATMPPPSVSPPPSYRSLEVKGRRSGCRSRSLCPAGGIVTGLLGMLGFGGRKSWCHRRSRRRPVSYL